jgi:hypothetical protein
MARLGETFHGFRGGRFRGRATSQQGTTGGRSQADETSPVQTDLAFLDGKREDFRFVIIMMRVFNTCRVRGVFHVGIGGWDCDNSGSPFWAIFNSENWLSCRQVNEKMCEKM